MKWELTRILKELLKREVTIISGNLILKFNTRENDHLHRVAGKHEIVFYSSVLKKTLKSPTLAFNIIYTDYTPGYRLMTDVGMILITHWWGPDGKVL